MTSPMSQEPNDVHTQARELGHLGKFSELAQLLQTADQLNRAVVTKYLPAIVANHFFMTKRFSGDLFVRWTDKNPKWYAPLQHAADDPERLPRHVGVIWERFREYHDDEVEQLKAVAEKGSRPQ